MGTAIFPTLKGLAFDVGRTLDWSGTTVFTSASGKRTAVADWSYPRRLYELTYSFLRSDPTHAELQALEGFYNACRGQFDTFLFTDPDDNAVVGQTIAVGDGATTAFQLARSFGAFEEPIFAPNTVSAVYVNGVSQAGWTVSTWGSAVPGMVTLAAAPAAGAVITADLSYYFPCRFDDPQLSFKKFMSALFSSDSVKFSTEK